MKTVSMEKGCVVMDGQPPFIFSTELSIYRVPDRCGSLSAGYYYQSMPVLLELT